MRRILQAQGCEVVHLGHDRSVDEVVDGRPAGGRAGRRGQLLPGRPRRVLQLPRRAARRARRRPRAGLRRRRRRHRRRGDRAAAPSAASRSSRPQDGQRLGLAGMVNTLVARLRRRPRRAAAVASTPCSPATTRRAGPGDHRARAGPRPTALAAGRCARGGGPRTRAGARHHRHRRVGQVARSPTSWSAGFRLDQEDKLRIAVLAVDPTRRRGGGALLGDRIRMNSLDAGRASSSARWRPAAPTSELPRAPGRRRSPPARPPATTWSIVETPGIGQGDAAIVAARRRLALRHDAGVRRRLPAREDRHARLRRRRRHQQVRAARRARTPAATWPASWCATARPSARLGGHAGLRHQRRPLRRRRRHRALPAPARRCSAERGPAGRRRAAAAGRRPVVDRAAPPVLPPAAERYLAEIADAVRGYHAATGRAGRRWPAAASTSTTAAASSAATRRRRTRRPSCARDRRAERADGRARRDGRAAQLERWPATVEQYSGDELRLHRPRARDPHPAAPDDAVRHVGPAGGAAPHHRPRRAGALPARREPARRASRSPPGSSRSSGTREAPGPDVRRRGRPVRTNRRFHLLAEGQPATRLSTAFDSVTLYGRDPDRAPRRLRQGRHLRRLDRHPRRHEGAVRRVRPVLARPRRCR